jgi:Glycosyl hydrolase 108
MPGRKYSIVNTNYRYGFNGQERESELSENITTAEFWEYDSRIVRRWNIDPIAKENESPYLCFSGNPILLSDPTGDSATGDFFDKKTGKHLGHDGKKDDKVYHVEGSDKFDIKDFKTGGKYSDDKSLYSKDNGKEHSVIEWNYSIIDSKFNEFFPKLLQLEGGFVDNKNDPGGATNKGITLKEFKTNAIKLVGVEGNLDNLKILTKEQAAKLYEGLYWNPSKATNISDKQMGWLYIDTYINGGGTQVLASTLSFFNKKGISGLNTVLQIQKANEMFDLYKQERLCRFDNIIEKNQKFKNFRKGWYDRVNKFNYTGH